jgi:hypothetical protein
MKSKISLVLALTLASTSQLMAMPVTFDYSGTDGGGYSATGTFTIDDSLFDGTNFQGLPNTDITSLSFVANSQFGTFTFGTTDIDQTGFTFFDSSQSPVTVPDGGGFLATLNGQTIRIGMFGPSVNLLGFSDLGGGIFGCCTFFDIYSGIWTESQTAVPTPAALSLFASGLAGLGWLSRRRRKSAAVA